MRARARARERAAPNLALRERRAQSSQSREAALFMAGAVKRKERCVWLVGGQEKARKPAAGAMAGAAE